jgi:hypothetical protein
LHERPHHRLYRSVRVRVASVLFYVIIAMALIGVASAAMRSAYWSEQGAQPWR